MTRGYLWIKNILAAEDIFGVGPGSRVNRGYLDRCYSST